MKKSVKFLSLLLSLVLLISLFPVAAAAEDTGSGVPGTPAPPTAKVTVRAIYYKDVSKSGVYTTADASVTIDKVTSLKGSSFFGHFPTVGGRMYEYVGTSNGSNLDPAKATSFYVECYYIPHYHDYRIGYNRFNHWEVCRCGSMLSSGPHVDPAKDEDSICTCGYKFSNNANLVTLWLSNMQLSPRFVGSSENTEYVGNVFSYKDVTSSTVSYRAFDDLATVEAPTEVAIEEGMNVIEITVTAEDRKTTKTYTVFASKASKADGIVVTSTAGTDGTRESSLAPKAKMHRSTASLTLSTAVGEAMATQAENNESTRVVLEPGYSKWSIKTVEITMPSEILDYLSQTKADLVIKTFSGNIVVPNAEMKNIVKEGETLVFTLAKTDDNVVLTLTADGKEVKDAKITLEPAEK